MHRLRHDLDFLTSAGLLVSGMATAITGVVADLWDLNDFWYHTISGYVMGALAIAHVCFNWERLVAYARFRLVRRSSKPPVTALQRRAAAPAADSLTQHGEDRTAPLRWLGRRGMSRRGLLGLAVGGVGGWILGRGLRPSPPIPAGSDVGVIYHEWSKPGVIDVLGSVANWGQQPPLYKAYPGAPMIALPEMRPTGGLPTAEAITSRRSTRAFSPAPMSIDQLSQVLALGSGISADRWGNARRTAPSSGALYPIELYPVVHNVDGLERGLYHYAFREHALELIRLEDLRAHVVEQGLMQEFLGQCGAVVFLTQILQRMRFRYQDRSYRYGLVEVGHIGQNIYLAASSMGLGACAIGAFMDNEINAMLGVDGTEEAAIYMIAVGRLPATA
jgi:SagB-type dehydrogenase family enzyme